MTPLEKFVRLLKERGWQELAPFEYGQGEWTIVFDTSSWTEVATKNNPRVFDVPVPEDSRGARTINLIEHLCGYADDGFVYVWPFNPTVNPGNDTGVAI